MVLLLMIPLPPASAGGQELAGAATTTTTATTTIILMSVIFIVGGALLAAEDALENAAAAELLPEDQRGIGFGALAAVNSAGDLISSAVVGVLWGAFGPAVAFGSAIVPMMAGALLLGRRPR